MKISRPIQRAFLLAALTSCSVLFASGAAAQSYPARPVKIVVPFPAGAATDTAARLLAQKLSVTLGQAFFVENKPGANSAIGVMDVVRAPADGYTLSFGSNSGLAVNVALQKNVPYDPRKDFSPIAGFGRTVNVLMVKSSFPAKNLAEFITYVKQRPGKVNAGAVATTHHILIAALNKAAGIDLLTIPYKGTAATIPDLVGGSLDMSVFDLGTAIAHEKAGTLLALGVTSQHRDPLAPNVPAIAETVPGYDFFSWVAMVGPAGMPRDVVKKLNDAVAQALQQPDVVQKLATMGFSPMQVSPDQLKDFIGTEVEKWVRFASEANIQPE